MIARPAGPAVVVTPVRSPMAGDVGALVEDGEGPGVELETAEVAVTLWVSLGWIGVAPHVSVCVQNCAARRR
ncbi:hypothetical protein UK99_13530 [Frankia casuarinae]|nr:hypothetical protein Manayef4_19395 [Frankia sp. CgIM4]OHV54377.1 hypothetical protein CgIS1_12570 [Frankia sp. CgIS1]ORT47024.1 hypothetical protein KBI5_22045 [Frankia sp. KB5]ORT95282.1 hypothetical protein UK99_13530 [Frankia casuarinae]